MTNFKSQKVKTNKHKKSQIKFIITNQPPRPPENQVQQVKSQDQTQDQQVLSRVKKTKSQIKINKSKAAHSF